MATKKTIVHFESAHPNPQHDGVMDIDAEDLIGKLAQVHLIDVRQPEEFSGELGHIPGAQLLVLNTLPNHLHELPKGETIVFICRSGNRSGHAAAFAREHGFTHVFNLRGGMLRWNALSFATADQDAN
jgi:rhodanese-related sulfurtransferase